MKIKRIETKIGVKDALTKKTSIETDVYNEVIIEKETVPVILVPGIMGSRNENSAGDGYIEAIGSANHFQFVALGFVLIHHSF